jgi:hypothetical protein
VATKLPVPKTFCALGNSIEFERIDAIDTFPFVVVVFVLWSVQVVAFAFVYPAARGRLDSREAVAETRETQNEVTVRTFSGSAGSENVAAGERAARKQKLHVRAKQIERQRIQNRSRGSTASALTPTAAKAAMARPSSARETFKKHPRGLVPTK